MKQIFFIFFILCFLSGYSQKIALLSTDFQKPILYTDSLTVEQISTGYFAVGVNDFDTLVGSLNYLAMVLLVDKRSKMESWEFRAGKTTIKISKTPYAYGDRFTIVATSKFDEIETNMILTPKKSDKKNSSHLDYLIRYIASNRTIFKESYEIRPKFYNVVMVKQ